MSHHHRSAALLAASLLTLTTAANADVTPNAGMLRYPDVSATQIVFVYANDLWLVDREGGTALPLASPPGVETFPRFSPDGNSIAFAGNYDGGRDLYTIPTAGGAPVRVTHHPAPELMNEWVGDDRLLFASNGMSGLGRMPGLFTVGTAGGLPEALPVPYGGVGSISSDGTWLAYTPHTRDHRTWKRYRGGMATDIWLFNLKDHSSKRMTTWEGTDSQPMWHGMNVYYVSDDGPEHRLNIWKYDVDTGEREQITHFSEYDIKWPAIGPGPKGDGEIVFQNGARMFLLDLKSRKSTAVNVRIPGARPNVREHTVDASKFIQGWDISPTGVRAVAQARGDIWTLPAKNGMPRNLSRTDGVAERDPAWSPDGRWIAYFSDADGEYDLYITQSDGKGETRRLTEDANCFRSNPSWSPDSKKIAYADKTGALFHHDLESNDTTLIMTDPGGTPQTANWSQDNGWITYQRSSDTNPMSQSIWIYEVAADTATQVTSDMFGDGSPTFDREGKYLYFATNRVFAAPEYSTLDTSFVYNDTMMLAAVPLRNDIDFVWAPKSDEEKWSDDDKKKDDDGDDNESDDENDENNEGDDSDDSADDDDEAPDDDGVTGAYEGSMTGEMFPAGMRFSANLSLAEDGTLTGNIVVPIGTGTIEGTWDAESGNTAGTITTPDDDVAEFTGTIKDGALEWTVLADGVPFTLSGTRTASDNDNDNEDADDEEDDDNDDDDKDDKKVMTIDLDGFESRAISLPVAPGQFGNLAVNNRNQLLYVRGGGGGIKVFDITDDNPSEKAVAPGGGFAISADGKKILAASAGGAGIGNAGAGGTITPVPMRDMMVTIQPRDEWRQMFNDVWRIFRDYFYVENMHGVDWNAMRKLYAPMVEECASREDLSFVIGEMIAELNCGHSYYFGGDVENEPSRTVGLLGCDFELHDGAYRISRIFSGGPWDLDARGPLSMPGVDVKEGDYLLAVNGIPLDTNRDPWAAFIGLADRDIELTVNDVPEMNDDVRNVYVKALGSEGNLRYRAWIEANRAYVAEKTNGRVGYIYVPNTGVQGQNDLFRQFYGQIGLDGLIIDERWNGGGQIPTRFIELLNRPRTNYWAVRDGRDWAWPPDSHQGAKCMLINGLAGSGGDMFPYLFRQAGLGKLIGTRTWGGLVGISGNPGLIDGGYGAVPTFGFYERDGTWGIEGHGVDPDIEVVDDPALMVDGGDPQLDAAIAHMKREIKQNPYAPPARPKSPDRSGIGVTSDDR
jgi:tricorn protease-like protein/C-terminal processing protease CtpA/Prc